MTLSPTQGAHVTSYYLVSKDGKWREEIGKKQALCSLICTLLGHTRAGALDTGNHGKKWVRFWVLDTHRCVLGLSPHSRETSDLASLCGVSKSLSCLLWIFPSTLGSTHFSSNIHNGFYSVSFGNTSNNSVKEASSDSKVPKWSALV